MDVAACTYARHAAHRGLPDKGLHPNGATRIPALTLPGLFPAERGRGCPHVGIIVSARRFKTLLHRHAAQGTHTPKSALLCHRYVRPVSVYQQARALHVVRV